MDSPASLRSLKQSNEPTIILEDLLNGANEWQNIQDIVRMTFKALNDVLRQQALEINQVKKAVNEKSDFQEIDSLAKATKQELNQAVHDMQYSIETRFASIQERTDQLDRVQNSKITRDEAEKMISLKQVNDTSAITVKFEQLQNYIHEWSDHCARKSELDNLAQALLDRPSLQEVDNLIKEKASKQGVVNALHKKVNIHDFTDRMAQKVDKNDIQELINIVEKKADLSDLKKICDTIDDKTTEEDVLKIVGPVLEEDIVKIVAPLLETKLDKRDVEVVQEFVLEQRKDIEDKIENSFCDFEGYVKGFRDEFTESQKQFISQINNKAETQEIDRLAAILLHKPDITNIQDMNNLLKSDISDLVGTIKSDCKFECRKLEEIMHEKTQISENKLKQVAEDIMENRDQLQNLVEESRSDLDEINTHIQQLVSTIKNDSKTEVNEIRIDIDAIQEAIEEIATNKANLLDIKDCKDRMREQINMWVDAAHLSSQLTVTQSAWQEQLENHKKATREKLQLVQEELQTGLDYHIQNLKQIMADVPSMAQVQEAIGSTKDGIQRYMEEVTIDTKKDIHSQIQIGLEGYQGMLGQKADTRDICALLDSKANIDDINKILIDLHSEIDTKPSIEQLTSQIEEQSEINEALCSEN